MTYLSIYNNGKNLIFLIQYIYIFSVSLLVSISGIFWLPNISSKYLVNLKQLLFTLIGICFILMGFKIKRLLIAPLILLFFCSISAFISGFITIDSLNAFSKSRDFFLVLLFITSLNYVHQSILHQIIYYSIVFSSITLLIELVPLWNILQIIPILETPIEVVTTNDFDLNNLSHILESHSTLFASFSGTRTSAGLFLSNLSLFLVSNLLFLEKINKKLKYSFVLLILLLTVICLIILGARSGFIIYLISSLFYIKSLRSRLFILIISSFILYLIFALDIIYLLPDYFIRGFTESSNLYNRIDTASTGRLSSIIGGIRNFLHSPLIGVGPINSRIPVNDGEFLLPHNSFIRILSEFGLSVFLPFFIFFIIIFQYSLHYYKLIQTRKNGIFTNNFINLMPNLVSFFLFMLVEPLIFIGSFNLNIIFIFSLTISIIILNKNSKNYTNAITT